MIPSQRFTPQSPRSVIPTLSALWQGATKAVRAFFVLLFHVFTVYDDSMPDPKGISDATGQLTEEQLDLCKRIYDEEEKRHERLEQKATILLSVVALVVPLLVSGAYFIATKEGFNPIAKVGGLVFTCFAGILLLVSFISLLRALAIKPRINLSVYSLFNTYPEGVKRYNPDFYGRGLLYCSSVNGALNNLLADFVRAAQVFLVVAVFLEASCSIPLILTLTPSDSIQEVKGKVTIESAGLDKAVELENKLLTTINILRDRVWDLESQAREERTRIEALERNAKKHKKPVRGPGAGS